MSNKHTITKKIEGKIWEEALDKSFEKNVKKAKVDGFREGKCPRNIYEKKYGVESLYNDAVDIILPAIYTEVLKESELKPIIQPGIDIKNIDKNGVEFEFVIITEPEVKIKKYKGLKVTKEVIKVSKEEINAEIDALKNQYAEIVIKKGAIENGDTAVIDFEGFKDGVAFEGGKGENYPLEIGSNTFIPGFEEQLIGLKANDTKEVEVTFPNDYPSEDLKGAKVIFKVLIHEIKTRSIPEINDDFFKDLNIEGVKYFKTLEEHCKKSINEKKEKEAENKYIDSLLEAISKETTVEIPEELIHEEIHHMIDTYEERLKMQGLTLEQYMEFTKQTIDKLEAQLEPEAKKNITYRYMLEEISKLENISVNDKDVEVETDKLAETYNMTKEELIKAFGGEEMIQYDLKVRKTLDFLKENN